MDKFSEVMDNLGARRVNMVTVFIWFLAQLVFVPQLESKLYGDHVCQTEIIVPQQVTKWELKNRTTRTYKWCMSVPPRCSVYSNKVVNETETSVVNITKVIETCCEGFNEQNNYCVSQCPGCQNGLCLQGTCLCLVGWVGPKCDSRIAVVSRQPGFPIISSFSTESILLKDPGTQQSTGVLNRIDITSHSTHQEEHFTTPTYSSVTSTISTLDRELSSSTSANTKGYWDEYNNLLEIYSTLKPTSKYVDVIDVSSTSRQLIFEQELLITSNEDLEGSGSRHRGKTEEFYPIQTSSFDKTVTVPSDPNWPRNEENSQKAESYEAISSHVEIDEGDDIDYRELDRLIFKENIDNGTARSNEENKVEELDMLNSRTTVSTKSSTSRKETSIFKENYLENIDLTGERFEKRSSMENLSQNTKLTITEPSNKHLVYSICAASLTTFLILVIVVTLYAIRNSKKKVEKNKAEKDIGVAVYTTSIFHSPLPDLPTFDNPTYLATGINGNNRDQTKRQSIEIQELNLVFQKPSLRAANLDSKPYLYDHPPSTGSYRASSEVDTLSHYNLSQKSQPGIVLEPLYDEIPSKDPRTKSDCELLNSNGDPKTRRNVDTNNLYMNTCGRTKF